MSTSSTVRAEIVEALKLDLIGPDNNHAFAHELLSDPPSRWYMTGFLVPTDAPIEHRRDETSDEEIDSGDDSEATDDATPPDRGAARKSLLPSSMGLSVLVPAAVNELEAVVSWGDYIWEAPDKDQEPADQAAPVVEPPEGGPDAFGEKKQEYRAGEAAPAKPQKGYRRIPREERVTLSVPRAGERSKEYGVPNSEGLSLALTTRSVSAIGPWASQLPAGTRSVSVFLVNRRKADEDHRYRKFAFQTCLTLVSKQSFVPRPDLRGACGLFVDEWDEQVSDLQFRDVFEFAVGHGVSATERKGEDGQCLTVLTTWIPTAEVERVAPAKIRNVELGMEGLGRLVDGAEARTKLAPLVEQYRDWIKAQEGKCAGLDAQRARTASDLLVHAGHAAKRIEAGIAALNDAEVLEAFRIANRAMAEAARSRDAIQQQVAPAAVDAPQWRPFQLAFILMTLPGLIDPTHVDREVVDLLFFPTGGGKTEAYLGLAAFSMVLRRLRHPGIRSAGMSVLMRYTLRLLTLDQLGRASALMCALELEREKQPKRLGEWPFEIGLWVGSAATPNRMGHRGYTGPGRDTTAYIKTRRFNSDSSRYPSPIPVENCPWCGSKFEGGGKSFRLVPTEDKPLDLRVRCVNDQCEFSGKHNRWLPVVAVDEPIYRRLPAFIIATVDKFAALPWTGETGTLFGCVDRFDQHGFYGPCSGNGGTPLGGPLPPPDLIIQDELHLISGPLGTIAGVYETVIDCLASRPAGEKVLRPKIIASTATVRRADSQIRALFSRQQVAVFPPPGPDRTDSFFAKTESSTKTPARQYVGIAAQGRSLKVVLLRASLAILGAAQTLYEREGGKRNKQNPVDPYMTLLGYFNSLRELGGSRRIVEDEVRTRVSQYSRRRRRDPEDKLFTSRNISYEVLELTSRVSTDQVASAKRRLTQPFYEDDHVDVALATNMISVGLDIIRLGLMVVLGQPKTSAEYIQATSRVGRDAQRPGLVVTLLNVHKPRDRSHYERFEMYHSTFYRAVEVTSVTPFSPRALDRALAAALVGLCRHGRPEMTPPLGAGQILHLRGALDAFAMKFGDRALLHDAKKDPHEAEDLRQRVLAYSRSLLDDWMTIARNFQETNVHLKYQPYEKGGGQRLLYEFLNPELQSLPAIRKRFRANRSMRDVEADVEVTVKNINDWADRP